LLLLERPVVKPRRRSAPLVGSAEASPAGQAARGWPARPRLATCRAPAVLVSRARNVLRETPHRLARHHAV